MHMFGIIFGVTGLKTFAILGVNFGVIKLRYKNNTPLGLNVEA